MECLRIKAEMYDRNKPGEITRAYREAMDKRMGEDGKGWERMGEVRWGIHCVALFQGGARIKFCNTFQRKRQVNITCPK